MAETEDQRQGRLYLEEGRRQQEKQPTGFLFNPSPEPEPKREGENEVQAACRKARNMLKLGMQAGPTDPDFAAWVEECRAIQREKNRQASIEAGEWLRNYKREQGQFKAEDEARKKGKSLCADCGVEIDPKYERCYACHGLYL